jgi:hypothetical protein
VPFVTPGAMQAKRYRGVVVSVGGPRRQTMRPFAKRLLYLHNTPPIHRDKLGENFSFL